MRRSDYYATNPALPAPARSEKRGPKTPLDDAALLVLIRADLAQSPFRGEGRGDCVARDSAQSRAAVPDRSVSFASRSHRGGSATRARPPQRRVDPDDSTDPAAVPDVADGQGEDFGDAKPEEQLRRNERTVARVDAPDVSDEVAFFGGSEGT